MKITGDVEKLELSNIKFTNLRGSESRCQESFEDFEEGDNVIVISKGIVKNSNIELNDGIYFVKTKVADQFLSRFVESLKQEDTKLIVKPAEAH